MSLVAGETMASPYKIKTLSGMGERLGIQVGRTISVFLVPVQPKHAQIRQPGLQIGLALRLDFKTENTAHRYWAVFYYA
jgi:hypothetical protein